MVRIWWYITDFFNFIWEAIKTIVGFFDVVVDMITSSVEFLLNLASSMPYILIIPLSALIAISVIYKLLGRGEQS